jgi:hypothetical protein
MPPVSHPGPRRRNPPSPRLPPRRALADLEDVAARYRAVVEQNRALYNEVQDLKGSIRVFCRIRWDLGVFKLLDEAGSLGGAAGQSLRGCLALERLPVPRSQRPRRTPPRRRPQAAGRDGRHELQLRRRERGRGRGGGLQPSKVSPAPLPRTSERVRCPRASALCRPLAVAHAPSLTRLPPPAQPAPPPTPPHPQGGPQGVPGQPRV